MGSFSRGLALFGSSRYPTGAEPCLPVLLRAACLPLSLRRADEVAETWYRCLQQAQQAMQELAGEGAVLLPPDWEEASSTVSGTEGEESTGALAATQVCVCLCCSSLCAAISAAAPVGHDLAGLESPASSHEVWRACPMAARRVRRRVLRLRPPRRGRRPGRCFRWKLSWGS